jgi:hypothetical protein
MYQCLEPLAVVRLKQVGKLVHNYIILDPLRKFGQLAADANGPSGAVAGPTSALLVWGVLDAVPGEISLKVSAV